MKSLKRIIGRPDRDDFATIVIEAIRQTGNPDSIEYDSKNFTLIVGGAAHLYLTNLYEEYSTAARRQRSDILKRYVSGWMSMGEDKPSLEDALPNLLPVVRTSSYQDLMKSLDLNPPRFKVEDFPSPEQLAAMGVKC